MEKCIRGREVVFAAKLRLRGCEDAFISCSESDEELLDEDDDDLRPESLDVDSALTWTSGSGLGVRRSRRLMIGRIGASSSEDESDFSACSSITSSSLNPDGGSGMSVSSSCSWRSINVDNSFSSCSESELELDFESSMSAKDSSRASLIRLRSSSTLTTFSASSSCN